MNQYEKDLAIYRAIADKANEVFNTMFANVGVYTARQIKKNIDTNVFGYPEGFDFFEKHEITVDTFSCSFKVKDVFWVMRKFEQLIKPADRISFEKTEIVGDKVLEFDVTKKITPLLKCLGEEWRGVISHVCIDTKLNAIVVTNGCTLIAQAIDIQTFGKARNFYVADPSAFKSDKVVISEKDGLPYANGKESQFTKFVNWRPLVPNVSDNHAVRFAKWSDFTKTVKQISKLAFSETIVMTGEIGNTSIKISSDDYERRVALSEPLRQDIDVTLNVENTLKMPKADKLYIVGGGRAIVAASDDMLAFCLPIETRKADKENGINLINKIFTKKTMKKYDAPTTNVKCTALVPVAIKVVMPQPKAEVMKIELPERKVLALPAPVAETEEADAVELKTINGITEGDFVMLETYSGDKIVCKLMQFTKKGQAKLNLKGWNKFTFPIEFIEPTTETKCTLPAWLKAGQDVTNGNGTKTIAEIKRARLCLPMVATFL